MVLLAIFNVMLARISGQEDIVVGTGIEGRRHEDLRDIIGMFINTLPIRNFPQGEKTFIEFLREVKKTTLRAFDNQEYQFEDLVEKVAPDRDATRNPLFDVSFQLQNIELPTLEITGMKLMPYNNVKRISKFDLTLWAFETGEILNFAIEYSTKLFKEETIEWFARHFKDILSFFAANPGEKLSEIRMIFDKERNEILSQFSGNLEND